MSQDPLPKNSNEMNGKIITYHYRFVFGNGKEKEFTVKLNEETLDLVHDEKNSYPRWTELKFCKCSNCPLKESEHKYCPAASKLVDVIDHFKEASSTDEVDIIIGTDPRIYMKHTPLQKGISSLIGIYMVSSGCPVMAKLKPMVRHHLPFATLDETNYRAISMYLMAQYFLLKKGKTPDWELKNLVKIYDDVHIVNKSFCERLSYVVSNDASLNAMVALNAFADSLAFRIDKNKLDKIERLFDVYLKSD